MMELVQKYLDNLNRINALSKNSEELSSKKSKENRRLTWYVYMPKIRALEHERDEKCAASDESFDQAINANEDKIESLREPISEVERILSFLVIKPVEVTLDDSIVLNKGRHNEPLGPIFTDDFLKIKAFILGNRKPTNKYTLALYGKSIFDKDHLPFPYNYGLPGHTTESCQISTGIKDFPTVQGAKDYFNKHKDHLLSETIEEYKKVKAEYLQAISTYKIEDFRELFAFECKACGFFLTEVSKNGWARSGDDCPKCGISQKEANKIAGIAKKNLPLFISYEWSEEGKEFFQRRLNEVMVNV
jgi:hypothetical protein